MAWTLLARAATAALTHDGATGAAGHIGDHVEVSLSGTFVMLLMGSWVASWMSMR